MMTHTTDVDTSPAELAPVELDPPRPEIVCWQELAAIDVGIFHEGDTSKVTTVPRPAWSDPERDVVANALTHTRYRSALAEATLGFEKGLAEDDYLEPATAQVQALMFGDGTEMVHFATQIWKGDDWVSHGINLSAAEALNIAELLTAAAALIGGRR